MAIGDLFANKSVDLDQQLGALASRYRGANTDDERNDIAKEYENVVKQLIRLGNWSEVPPPEDQLPDEKMPQAFFEHWQRST